jgi:hypothetical protein
VPHWLRQKTFTRPGTLLWLGGFEASPSFLKPFLQNNTGGAGLGITPGCKKKLILIPFPNFPNAAVHSNKINAVDYLPMTELIYRKQLLAVSWVRK